jgi:hypothetical protein
MKEREFLEKKVERELMSEEEFKKYLEDNRGLKNFDAVRKYKSVARAIRRGHVTDIGVMAPKRPFNNRANTCKRKGTHSRTNNELKKRIYGEYKERFRELSAVQ